MWPSPRHQGHWPAGRHGPTAAGCWHRQVEFVEPGWMHSLCVAQAAPITRWGREEPPPPVQRPCHRRCMCLTWRLCPLLLGHHWLRSVRKAINTYWASGFCGSLDILSRSLAIKPVWSSRKNVLCCFSCCNVVTGAESPPFPKWHGVIAVKRA